MSELLPLREVAAITGAAGALLDAATLATAAAIVADVERDGAAAVRRHAERLGDLTPGAPLVHARAELAAAFAAQPLAVRELLQRTAARIERFAQAQRASLREFDLPVPGGVARQRLAPVASAGCYAPGGRHPLPSSVLMTAVTARAAGVATVVVASPRPAPITLAAAHVASADALLAIGGAQAIAALAFGAAVPRCDLVVGPGNRFVAAAKQLVQGRVGVDLPAGPSELVVLADATADARIVAADLLAQAEHDADARPVLVALDAAFASAVRAQLALQLDRLPTANASTARRALQAGAAVVCADLDQAIAVCDRLAPEHLQLAVADATARTVAARVRHFGALFAGRAGAEVYGDYGAGPNHVLPTGGAARWCGGLSVLAFLRVRTELWLDTLDAQLAADAAALAELEGLAAHAAAARARA